MIDIHTHVIPNIDDGSPNLETSVNLIDDIYKNGTTDVICTPHYRKPYLLPADEVKRKFEEFKDEIEKRGIPINLYLGQEIYCKGKEYKEILKEKKAHTLCGGKFVLLEFDFTTPCDVADMVYETRCMGYNPIVAHVERYSYLTLDDVYEIKKVGGLIQVNSDSVIGDGGRYAKKFVKKLFIEGFVDFVASDLHFGRNNSLKKAYDFVKRKFGEDAAKVVFEENAKRILKG